MSSTITRGLFSVTCHHMGMITISDNLSYMSEQNYTLSWKTSHCQPTDIPLTSFRNRFYWMQQNGIQKSCGDG